MPRVVLAASLLLLGLAVGLASVAVHPTWWGLPLALVATTVTAYAAPRGWAGRLPFVLGWASVIAVLTMPRSEGDFLIASDVHGYALIGFAVVLVVGGFVTLPPPRNNAPSAPSSS